MELITSNGTFECDIISASQSRKAVSVVLPASGKLSETIANFEGLTFLEWQNNGETIHIDNDYEPTRVVRTSEKDSLVLEQLEGLP